MPGRATATVRPPDVQAPLQTSRKERKRGREEAEYADQLADWSTSKGIRKHDGQRSDGLQDTNGRRLQEGHREQGINELAGETNILLPPQVLPIYGNIVRVGH